MLLIDIYVIAVAVAALALFVMVTRNIRNQPAIQATPEPLVAKAA